MVTSTKKGVMNMAANPFLQLDVIRNASREGKRITDCYRLMYNRELWMNAYTKLCPYGGNLTNEVSAETMDRDSLHKIDEIIAQLKAGTFRFALVKRANPLNGKGKRRFELPCFKDQLVLQVMRVILEQVYEPVFSANSHGFREGRSCHTALSQIKRTWTGLEWCLKGDFTGLFGQMDHSLLIKLISQKLDDRRFLLLIHHALLADVTQEGEHKTFSGINEGGILSPLLANIYLHEFDLFIDRLAEQFAYGKMKYVRYADHFVGGITGSKRSAMCLQRVTKVFLKEELHLLLNDDQIRITHLKKPVSFLGYQLCRWGKRQAFAEPHKPSLKTKTLAGAISLEIPKNQMKEFVSTNGYGNLDNFKVIHRANLVNRSELEILHTYNAELRAIATYYKLADNYSHLDRLFYLAESSFIKTIAHKRRCTSRQAASRMRKHKQGVLSLLSKDKHGSGQLHQFVKLKELPKHGDEFKADSPDMDAVCNQAK